MYMQKQWIKSGTVVGHYVLQSWLYNNIHVPSYIVSPTAWTQMFANFEQNKLYVLLLQLPDIK